MSRAGELPPRDVELRRVLHAVLDRVGRLIGEETAEGERSSIDAGAEGAALDCVLANLGADDGLDVPIDQELRALLVRASTLLAGDCRSAIDALRSEDRASAKCSMRDADYRAALALRRALQHVYGLEDRDATRIRIHVDIGAYKAAFDDLVATLRAYGPFEVRTREILLDTARAIGVDPASVG